MPLKEEAKKDYQRDYMRKKRSNKAQGLTGGSNTYPAIIHALADPIKRAKLEKITQSLKDFKVADKVFYGYPGLGGVPFDIAGEYLEATR